MQDLRRKIKAKKIASKWIWDGLGLNLGRLWDGLGRLLGSFGCFLVVSWRSKSNFLKALVQDGPQEASGIDLGLILEGFGQGFGRVWEGFEKSLDKD